MIPSGGDGGRSRDSELPLQRRGERGQLAVALNAAELRFGGEHAGGRPVQRISDSPSRSDAAAPGRFVGEASCESLQEGLGSYRIRFGPGRPEAPLYERPLDLGQVL